MPREREEINYWFEEDAKDKNRNKVEVNLEAEIGKDINVFDIDLRKSIVNYDILEKYSGRGLRLDEVCAVVGIGPDTYRKLIRTDEQFRLAVMRGKSKTKILANDTVTGIMLDPRADDSDRLRAASMILNADQAPTNQINIQNNTSGDLTMNTTVLTEEQMLRGAAAYLRLRGSNQDDTADGAAPG